MISCFSRIKSSEQRNPVENEQKKPEEIKPKLLQNIPILLEPIRQPADRDEILKRNTRTFTHEDDVERRLKKTFQEAQEESARKDPIMGQAWKEADHKQFKSELVLTYEDCLLPGNTAISSKTQRNTGISCTQGWKRTMDDVSAIGSFQVDLNGQLENINYYALFDGHQGSKCAIFLAENIENHLKKRLQEEFSKAELPERVIIVNVLKLIFVEIGRMWMAENPNAEQSKSTALLVMTLKGILWTANVGDSGGVLLKGEDNIKLTREAKPDDDIFRAGVETRRGRVQVNSNPIFPPRVIQPLIRRKGIIIEKPALAFARAVGHSELYSGVNPRAKVLDCPYHSGDILILTTDAPLEFAIKDEIALFARENLTETPEITPTELSTLLVQKTCQAALAESRLRNLPPEGDNTTVLVSIL